MIFNLSKWFSCDQWFFKASKNIVFDSRK